MINPYGMDRSKYKVLAWTQRLSDCYLGARNKGIDLDYDFKEIEACYFPETKSLGFQFHPN